MADEENEEHEGDDQHIVNIEIEFEIVSDEDDEVDVRAAAIRSHVHGVPLALAAQTLVITAHKILADHMAHTLFEGAPNHEVAHAMAHAAAAAYLIEAVKNAPTPDEVISTMIPDDISELLGE